MEMTSTVVSACFKLIAGYKEGASSNVKDFPLPNDEQKKTPSFFHEYASFTFLCLYIDNCFNPSDIFKL